MQNIQQDIGNVFQASRLAIQGVTAMSDIINVILDNMSKIDPASKALKDRLKSDKANYVHVNEDNIRAVEKRFRERGIPFMTSRSSSLGKDYIVIYARRDEKEVSNLLGQYKVEKGLEGIVSKESLNAYAGGQIRQIKDLDEVTSTRLLEHCRTMGVPIAVDMTEWGTYRVSFAEKDAAGMDKARARTAIELSGVHGKAVKKQVEYQIQKQKLYTEDILNTKDSFHIVDLDRNHMAVTKDGIRIIGDQGEYSIKRDHPEFNKVVAFSLSEMRDPVRLEDNEIDLYLKKNHKDRLTMLTEKEKMAGRPMFTIEEARAIKKMEKDLALYEAKIAQDNPEHDYLQYSFENSDIPMSRFEEEELDNYEYTHDNQEGVQLNDEVLDDARYKYRDMQDVKQEVDFEDEEINDEILESRYQEEEERDIIGNDYGIDSIDPTDLNENGIIDSFEDMSIDD